MNSEAFLVEYKVYERVGYYTLQCEDRNQSELTNFVNRVKQVPELVPYLGRLFYWIKRIGEIGINENDHFRHEGICKALPPDIKFTHEINELRLYCHVLTNNIVILFNGDKKTPGARSSQQCNVVEPHRKRAERWTQKLDKADIETDYTTITNLDDIYIVY